MVDFVDYVNELVLVCFDGFLVVCLVLVICEFVEDCEDCGEFIFQVCCWVVLGCSCCIDCQDCYECC